MGAIARIILRYGAGILVAKGFFAPEYGQMLSNDPDIEFALEVGLGMAVAAGTEVFYYLAKRWGWNT